MMVESDQIPDSLKGGEVNRLTVGLVVGIREKEKEVEKRSQIFDLNNWRMEFPFTEMRKTRRFRDSCLKIKTLGYRQVKFEIPIERACGDV